jgi:gluconate 5-dehydrogenase
MAIQELFDLTGKVALVTGSGRGLGRAFAEALAGAGANVVCTGRMLENTEKTAKILAKYGRDTLALQADISMEEEVQNMVAETVKRFGHLDIIVNNAGVVGGPLPAHELSLEEWNRVIAVDLTGVFLCVREAAKVMVEQRSGKIINIASIGGLVANSPPMPPAPAYNAAKGGVINLTRELAIEYAPYGINVNCIAPGAFKTDILEPLVLELKPYMESLCPLRKEIGRPEDLKGTLIYLASKASDLVTGHILVVDQGALAKAW